MTTDTPRAPFLAFFARKACSERSRRVGLFAETHPAFNPHSAESSPPTKPDVDPNRLDENWTDENWGR
jgi:hypothetical protein